MVAMRNTIEVVVADRMERRGSPWLQEGEWVRGA
jgi:hypothetical protein